MRAVTLQMLLPATFQESLMFHILFSFFDSSLFWVWSSRFDDPDSYKMISNGSLHFNICTIYLLCCLRVVCMDTWEVESISSMFNYVVYLAFIIGNILCLAFAVKKNSFLVKSIELPAPKDLRYCLLNIALWVIGVLQYQVGQIQLYFKNGNPGYLLNVLYIIIFLMTRVTSNIVVGVATQQFCIKVKQAETTAMPASSQAIFDPLVKDFKNLKKGLGPQLFHIFFIKSIIIIYYAFQLLVGNGVVYLFAFITELLAFDYLISAVDNTYLAFKNTSQTLK